MSVFGESGKITLDLPVPPNSRYRILPPTLHARQSGLVRVITLCDHFFQVAILRLYNLISRISMEWEITWSAHLFTCHCLHESHILELAEPTGQLTPHVNLEVECVAVEAERTVGVMDGDEHVGDGDRHATIVRAPTRRVLLRSCSVPGAGRASGAPDSAVRSRVDPPAQVGSVQTGTRTVRLFPGISLGCMTETLGPAGQIPTRRTPIIASDQVPPTQCP
jgi:hypothetical protein